MHFFWNTKLFCHFLLADIEKVLIIYMIFIVKDKAAYDALNLKSYLPSQWQIGSCTVQNDKGDDITEWEVKLKKLTRSKLDFDWKSRSWAFAYII